MRNNFNAKTKKDPLCSKCKYKLFCNPCMGELKEKDGRFYSCDLRAKENAKLIYNYAKIIK